MEDAGFEPGTDTPEIVDTLYTEYTVYVKDCCSALFTLHYPTGVEVGWSVTSWWWYGAHKRGVVWSP